MATVSLSAIVFIYFFFCVTNGQVPGDLRLTRNGISSTSYSYGRLQVHVSGRWGEICGDEFNETERDVACHQLGYISSLSNTTRNSYGSVGDVLLSEVDCYGNGDYLHILRCSYKTGIHNCQDKYTTLYCNTTSVTPYNGQLRLSRGATKSQGVVEVYCNGQWGSVCGRYFTPDAAHLICRQLGYTAAKAYSNETFRSYYSTVWLDQLHCTAGASDGCLASCTSCPRVPVRCGYSYALNVQCVFEALHYELGSNATSCEFLKFRPRLGEVRLVNETEPGVGVVQVVYADNNDTVSKDWMSVCGGGTNNYNNAITLCQQLGYNQVSNYTVVSTANSLQMLPSCSSAQPHILWCSRQVTYCNKSLIINCSSSSSLYYTGQVRLVGGDYPSEGRLEIYIRGSWGSIYVSSYYYNYKNVADRACRQLGYTGAVADSVGTIPGSGTVWYRLTSSYYSSYYCYSYYSNCFSRCVQYRTPYPDNEYYYETHSYDIAINCTFDVNSRVSVGSRDDCEIYVSPSPTPHSSPVIGVLLGSLAFSIIVVIVILTIVICCCVMRQRKKERQPRAANMVTGAPGVAYTAQGQNIAYVQPGAAVPPGMILVPVAQPNSRVNPAAVATPTNNEDETKEEPTPNDEIRPQTPPISPPPLPPVTD